MKFIARKITFSLALLWIITFSASAQAQILTLSAPPTDHLMGQITAINGTILTMSERDKTYTVETNQATITVDGQTANISSLAVGDRVLIKSSDSTETTPLTATAVEKGGLPPTPGSGSGSQLPPPINTPNTEFKNGSGSQLPPPTPREDETKSGSGSGLSNRVPATNNQAFTDVGTASTYYTAINYARQTGLVNGYSDGTYRPQNTINRAEFAKILMQAAYANDLTNYQPTACFTDVNRTDWFAKYVCLAKEKGVITGYDDHTFRPQQTINVAEALKITVKTLVGELPDGASGNWYQKYVNYAKARDVMLLTWGDVEQNVNRGELAQFIYNMKSQ